jgi:hypothetical protein
MSTPGVVFPLSLRPVLRGRQGGSPDAAHLPYHPAVWIVDANGNRTTVVAPHSDDLRAGRGTADPHDLVARAFRIVSWLERIDAQLCAWIAPLECPANFHIRPIITLESAGAIAQAGVQFCSTPDDEFDRLTSRLPVLAEDREIAAILEPLRQRVLRRYEAGITILAALQDAVQSWRSTEAITATDHAPTRIEDAGLEH